MASFEEFPCARCRDEVVGELLCLPCSVLSSHQKQFYNRQLTASPSLVEQHCVCPRAGRRKEIRRNKKNASSDVITSSLSWSRDTDWSRDTQWRNLGYMLFLNQLNEKT